MLCPEGSSSESDSQKGAHKDGIRFPFVSLGFWLDVWASLGLQQCYVEEEENDFCELFLMQL